MLYAGQCPASGWELLLLEIRERLLSPSWAGETLSAQPGSPKVVSTGGRMLYIEKVQLVDKGTYTCECRNAAGSSSKEHRLEVHGELRGPRGIGDLWGCLKVP